VRRCSHGVVLGVAWCRMGHEVLSWKRGWGATGATAVIDIAGGNSQRLKAGKEAWKKHLPHYMATFLQFFG